MGYNSSLRISALAQRPNCMLRRVDAHCGFREKSHVFRRNLRPETWYGVHDNNLFVESHDPNSFVQDHDFYSLKLKPMR